MQAEIAFLACNILAQPPSELFESDSLISAVEDKIRQNRHKSARNRQLDELPPSKRFKTDSS